MTKTSTFSTGLVDTYKGKRDVRAGWMVVTPTGKVATGHSLDRVTAERTARKTANDLAGHRCVYSSRSRLAGVAYVVGARQYAAKHGYKDIKVMEADYAAKRAQFVARCTIEVVDLD